MPASMTRSRRLAARGLVALGLVLGLGLTTTLPARAGSPPLRLAVSNTPASLPIYVAEAQRYFLDAGVEVATQECLGGPRCIAEMFEGRVDVATTTELSVALQAFTRSDFAIFATIMGAARDTRIVVRQSAGIQSPAQLAGKRIATVRGAGTHYYLDSALLYHGVDPRQVAIVWLLPEQVGPALVAGRVDAAVIWQPLAQDTLRALGADGLLLPYTRVYEYSFNLVALNPVLGARSDELVRLLRALDRAVAFIREQPAQAQAILKARLHVDQALVDAVWPDFKYSLALNQALVVTIEGELRWARREGQAPARQALPEVLPFIDTAPLRSAVPGAVTLLK